MFIPIWGILAGLCGLAVLAGAIALWIRSIRVSARLFRAVAEGSSDGLVLMERDSRIIWANSAYSRIMGYPHGSLIGRYPLGFALPARLALPPEEVRNFRFDEKEERFGKLTQMENVRADGTEFIHEFSHAAIHVGGAARFLLAGRDITDRVAREKALVAAKERLRKQSLTDALTGLSNRLHLQNCITEFLDGKTPFAVLQLDLNGMKQINDTFGHGAGDAVLRQVARGFFFMAKPDWVCARIGGDEFVVLLPGVDELEDALKIGRDLMEAIARPFTWQAASLKAEVSVGAAIWEPSVEGVDDLLHRSDIALYQAKSKNGPSIAGYDDDLARRYDEEQAFEREVREVVHNRGLSFVFQPIMNIEANNVERFEMLVRWRHGTRGVVSPGDFVPVIQQLGLCELLDRFVIDCAEAALKRLDAAGLFHVGLSINLSAEAFGSDDITDLLLWLVEVGRVDPSRLALEVLESTAFNEADPSTPVRLIG